MKKYIENLQQKPHPVRQKIVIVIAVVITAIIAIFWLATLPYRFSQSADVVSQKGPVSVIGENVSDIYNTATK